MAALKALVAVATITLLIQLAVGVTNLTVGSPGGSWDLTTNFTTWASSNTFVPGDNLVFTYTSQHDVLEVNKADHDSCTTSSPIQTYTGGNTVIALPAVATRYFICGTPGHCGSGMSVAINVVAASPPGSPSSPPPPATPPGSPSSPPPPATSTPSPPPPPGKSGAYDCRLQAKAAVSFGVGMLMILAL